MAELTKLVSVVGARPQFVKLAPIARVINEEADVDHIIVHTGQHYDGNMSTSFFNQLDIPFPDIDLGVGSARHGAQTAKMLVDLEAFLDVNRPDCVIVYGDTNSTLAATLAAVKMGIRLAHVESGLRSFDRTMPEEVNRVVADHCSDRLYAPTPVAIDNLQKEHLGDRALLSGDVMYDALIHNIELAKATSTALQDNGVEPGSYGLVTIHRAANTLPETLAGIVDALQDIADNQLPLLLPVHPRTRNVLNEIGFSPRRLLRFTSPLPYLDIITLIQASSLVITDSGGIQKEAALLGTPCVTLRNETEWIETVDIGANRLAGNEKGSIVGAVTATLTNGKQGNDDFREKVESYYGSGNAAGIIARDLLDWL